MHVAVLGGGYAGLVTARSLERRLPDDVDLTVVDDTGDHLLAHELHRTIRRPGLADAIAVPLVDLLDRADVRTARVETVDREARRVELADGGLDYDVVAVCLGGETAFFDLPGVEENATPLKRLEHAATIREEFRELVDAGGGTVVVGGAGLAGVQVAGELAAFARGEGVADDTRVLLVEQRDTVAPPFSAEFASAIDQELTAQGVEVRTGTAVRAADEEAVTVEDGEVAYDQFVWTGGIRGTDAMGDERPGVRPHLQVDERTFVVGDAGSVVDADGEAVPDSAQAAVRAGRVAARNVASVVDGLREGDTTTVGLKRWRFTSPGWVVSVGDSAVAQVGPTVLRGELASLAKAGVGVSYLARRGSYGSAAAVARAEAPGPLDRLAGLIP